MLKVVCVDKIQNFDHFRQRVVAAVNSVTPDIVQLTWADVEYWPDVCI